MGAVAQSLKRESKPYFQESSCTHPQVVLFLKRFCENLNSQQFEYKAWLKTDCAFIVSTSLTCSNEHKPHSKFSLVNASQILFSSTMLRQLLPIENPERANSISCYYSTIGFWPHQECVCDVRVVYSNRCKLHCTTCCKRSVGVIIAYINRCKM